MKFLCCVLSIMHFPSFSVVFPPYVPIKCSHDLETLLQGINAAAMALLKLDPEIYTSQGNREGLWYRVL